MNSALRCTRCLRERRELRRRFGLWLRGQRKDRGWSQEWAARLVNYNRVTWTRIELGLTMPSARKALAIAQVFNLPAAEVLDRIETKPDA
jgi:transcriptional regulator with XRE-family HTH domain